MRRLLPLIVLLTAGIAFASGGSLIPELGGETPADPTRGPGVDLSDADTADAHVQSLLRQGTRGTKVLSEIALEDDDVAARGRAIVGLARAEGSLANDTLRQLREKGDPQLVRTWAYAASLQRADGLDGVLELAQQQARFPGSQRAVQLAVTAHMEGADTEQLLKLISSTPSLSASVGPLLLDAPLKELGRVMLTHPDDGVRRQAASWMGAQATQKNRGSEVADIVVAQLTHNPRVKEVPWKGGALYVPGIQWKKADARALVRTLIQWKLYCERTGKSGERNQVWNNLRSVQLLQAAGFKNRWPNDEQVLEEWAGIAGQADVDKLRREQGW